MALLMLYGFGSYAWREEDGLWKAAGLPDLPGILQVLPAK